MIDAVSFTLKACPNTPNCVSSLEVRAEKQVSPLPWIGNLEKTQAALEKAIEGLPGSSITHREAHYWKAEFKSKWLGFVDDVEFLFDEKNKRVEVRSASRMGRYDFEVNRKRIEKLRSLISS